MQPALWQWQLNNPVIKYIPNMCVWVCVCVCVGLKWLTVCEVIEIVQMMTYNLSLSD